MKKSLKIFILFISLLLGITTNGVAAELPPSNIRIDKTGIHFIYTKDNSDIFLEKKGMLPGDSVSGTLTVENNLKEPFEVFMKAERVGAQQKVDLCQVLDLSINYDGKNIYHGTVSGENGLRNNISLGTVKPGEKKLLNAKVILDGKATDNKYKNKKVDIDWIFTAIGTDSPDKVMSTKEESHEGGLGNDISNTINNVKNILPRTGYVGICGYGLACVLIGIGIFLVIKKKKYKNY